MNNDRDRRMLRLAEKKARRAQLEAELGARQRALPDKRYGVIYADPPWRFEPYSRVTGMDRAAENHYPTSPIAEIKTLNVRSIAAADCVLFLWATVPMLEQAFGVMRAWGFEPKSSVAWGKDIEWAQATGIAISTSSCWSERAAIFRRLRWVRSGPH